MFKNAYNFCSLVKTNDITGPVAQWESACLACFNKQRKQEVSGSNPDGSTFPHRKNVPESLRGKGNGLQKRKFLAVKVEFDEAETSALKHHNNEPYVDQVHTIRQATRWMTRFKTPTKDVTSYDMPWRAESRLRTRDVRMRLLI